MPDLWMEWEEGCFGPDKDPLLHCRCRKPQVSLKSKWVQLITVVSPSCTLKEAGALWGEKHPQNIAHNFVSKNCLIKMHKGVEFKLNK